MPALVEMARDLQAPWLGLYGDLDEGTPVEEVESLRSAVSNARVPTNIVRYPDPTFGS
ncbi:MAG: hypothetical protein ACYDEY_16620 [Acidimicrobiales bacterium]